MCSCAVGFVQLGGASWKCAVVQLGVPVEREFSQLRRNERAAGQPPAFDRGTQPHRPSKKIKNKKTTAPSHQKKHTTTPSQPPHQPIQMHSHCLWHCQKCESNFKNSKNKETDSFSAAILLGSALYTEGYEAFKIHGSSKQELFQIPSFRRPPKSLRVGQFLDTNSSRRETLKQTFLLLSCSPNAGAGGPTKKGDGESSEYVYVYPTPSPSPPPPEHAKLNLKPTANSALGTVRQFWAWKNWQSSVVERQDSRQKNNDGRMNAEPGTVARLLFKYICTAPPASKI